MDILTWCVTVSIVFDIALGNVAFKTNLSTPCVSSSPNDEILTTISERECASYCYKNEETCHSWNFEKSTQKCSLRSSSNQGSSFIDASQCIFGAKESPSISLQFIQDFNLVAFWRLNSAHQGRNLGTGGASLDGTSEIPVQYDNDYATFSGSTTTSYQSRLKIVGLSGAFTSSTAATISFWMYSIDYSPSEIRYAFTCHYPSGSTGTKTRVYISTTVTGYCKFHATPSSSEQKTSMGTVTHSNWLFISCVLSATDGYIRSTVNAATVTTNNNVPTSTTPYFGDECFIGGKRSSKSFEGRMKCVSVSSRALSNNEINQLKDHCD